MGTMTLLIGRLLPVVLLPACTARSGDALDLPDSSEHSGDTGEAPIDTGNLPIHPGSPVERFVQVVVGDYHGCALTDRHRVQCWEPGDPMVDFGQADPPDELFSSLSAAGEQTCGLTLDGDLLCWGVDDGGGYDFGHPPSVTAGRSGSGDHPGPN
jgi:hypothetical protein